MLPMRVGAGGRGTGERRPKDQGGRTATGNGRKWKDTGGSHGKGRGQSPQEDTAVSRGRGRAFAGGELEQRQPLGDLPLQPPSDALPVPTLQLRTPPHPSSPRRRARGADGGGGGSGAGFGSETEEGASVVLAAEGGGGGGGEVRDMRENEPAGGRDG